MNIYDTDFYEYYINKFKRGIELTELDRQELLSYCEYRKNTLEYKKNAYTNSIFDKIYCHSVEQNIVKRNILLLVKQNWEMTDDICGEFNLLFQGNISKARVTKVCKGLAKRNFVKLIKRRVTGLDTEKFFVRLTERGEKAQNNIEFQEYIGDAIYKYNPERQY